MRFAAHALHRAGRRSRPLWPSCRAPARDPFYMNRSPPTPHTGL
jgi:hypothetical protein